MESKEYVEINIIKEGDIIYYLNHEDGDFYIESGFIIGENHYIDGVQVHGDGWSQYVSKYFITKVERDGEVIFCNYEKGVQ